MTPYGFRRVHWETAWTRDEAHEGHRTVEHDRAARKRARRNAKLEILEEEMANWKPTPEDIDFAGDCLLEALRAAARVDRVVPHVGDLAIERTSMDWEAVGYVIETAQTWGIRSSIPFLIWTTGRRLVRWWNADFYRIGPPGLRIPSLKYPTPEEIEASRLDLERR